MESSWPANCFPAPETLHDRPEQAPPHSHKYSVSFLKTAVFRRLLGVTGPWSLRGHGRFGVVARGRIAFQDVESSVAMKKLLYAFPFLLAVVPAAGQNQNRARIIAAPSPVQENQSSSTRNRTVAVNNTTAGNSQSPNAKPAWGDSVVSEKSSPSPIFRPRSTPVEAQRNATAPTRLVKPTSLSVDGAAPPAEVRAAHAAPPTSIYRVGIGDVLDIRLTNMGTRESTLFTVMKNGYLEYPLLAAPMSVVGLTPDEIARRLVAQIKVIQNPRPAVAVRDYASHTVLVTGAIDNPGRKILRREAVPLFAILAEALPRPDAAVVTLVRNGKEITFSLATNSDMSTLVMSGDTIRVSARAKQFVYVGGDVVTSGEKEFREGMTLTQLVLASGGVRGQSNVRIARRDASGLLKSEEYNLKAIEDGKRPDPLLQPGDRVEVKRSM